MHPGGARVKCPRRGPSDAPDRRRLGHPPPPLFSTAGCHTDRMPPPERRHPGPLPQPAQDLLKILEEKPRAKQTARLSALSLQQPHATEAGLPGGPARFRGNGDAGGIPAGSHLDDSVIICDEPQATQNDAVPWDADAALPLSRPARSHSAGADSPGTMHASVCRGEPVHLDAAQQRVMHGPVAVGARCPRERGRVPGQHGAAGERALVANSAQSGGGSASAGNPLADGLEDAHRGCGGQHGARTTDHVREVPPEAWDGTSQREQIYPRNGRTDECTDQQPVDAPGKAAEAGVADGAVGRDARVRSGQFEDAADGRASAATGVPAGGWARSVDGDSGGLIGGAWDVAHSGAMAAAPGDDVDEDSLDMLESAGTPPRDGGGEDHRALYLQLVHGVQVCALPCMRPWSTGAATA